MRQLIEFINKRIEILEQAAAESAAIPNPWRHRATEAKLILEKAQELRYATSGKKPAALSTSKGEAK